MYFEKPLTSRDHALLADWQRDLPDTRSSQQFLHNSTLRLVSQFTGQNIEPNPIPEVASDTPEAVPEALSTWNDTDSQPLVPSVSFQNADSPQISSDTLPTLPDRDTQTSSPARSDEFPLAPSVAFENPEAPPISLDALPTAMRNETLAALPGSDAQMPDFSSELPSALPSSSMPSWSSESSASSFISFDSASETPTSPTFVGFDFSSGYLPSVDQSTFADHGVTPPSISSPLVIANDFNNSSRLATSENLAVSIELVTMEIEKVLSSAQEKIAPLLANVVEGHIDEERAIALAKESQRRACLRR